MMFNEQIEMLTKYPEPDQLAILSKSIQGNYQGLIQPTQQRNFQLPPIKPEDKTKWI